MPTLTTVVVCYLLFVLPLLVRWLILLGAGIYRAGQTDSAPPKLFELPTLPRFKFADKQPPKRDESERLPKV